MIGGLLVVLIASSPFILHLLLFLAGCVSCDGPVMRHFLLMDLCIFRFGISSGASGVELEHLGMMGLASICKGLAGWSFSVFLRFVVVRSSLTASQLGFP